MVLGDQAMADLWGAARRECRVEGSAELSWCGVLSKIQFMLVLGLLLRVFIYFSLPYFVLHPVCFSCQRLFFN